MIYKNLTDNPEKNFKAAPNLHFKGKNIFPGGIKNSANMSKNTKGTCAPPQKKKKHFF